MFTLDRVGKYYKDGEVVRWVIRDLSLEVNPGQSLGIRGPSGSGKSTLLALLAGLIVPDEGSIVFKSGSFECRMHEATVSMRSKFRRFHVGFVYQFFNLIPTLTVGENVLLPLELTDQSKNRDLATARLAKLGLGDRKHAFPDELSGGEQQRVAIARAFAHSPAVILADEPTGNLDQSTATKAMDLLWQEAINAGSSLVVASHDDAVIKRCDHILALQDD